jgi:hypothetical protein
MQGQPTTKSAPYETADLQEAADRAATYAERSAYFAQLGQRYAANYRRSVSTIVALLLCALACVSLSFTYGPVMLLAALLLTGGVVLTLSRQGGIVQQRDHADALAEINKEGPSRLARDWDHLPLRQTAPLDAADELPYAEDLDLVGRASLLHLLGTANTPGGQTVLRRWLLEPAPPATIRERQAAVAELAPLIDLRDEIRADAHRIAQLQPTYEPFLRWAESPGWLLRRPALIWLSRLLPVLTVGFLLAEIAGVTLYPIWLGFAGLNWLLTWQAGRHVEELLDQVSSRQSAFQPYADLFTLVAAQQLNAPALRRIQTELASEGGRAGQQMARLARLMRFGDLRLSLFFPALQFLLLWNFHVLWLLERWKREAGPSTRAWLATLSDMEGLVALATLAYDHPAWAFPEVMSERAGDTRSVLVARGLGHPLLAPAVCVSNDITLGPAGTFVLVTGSNMSGKSTLLRAIGVNTVLAQAGGPVCATSLRVWPVALVTSMRVRDSLEQGISYFMAELRRLQLVVDAARRARAEGGRTALFLLDEILQGTNTSERQIAAAAVIQYLVASGATGAVSTHDLTLAQAPEVTGAAQLVHFTETFTRGADGLHMYFDYTLRPGLATSGNALKLMEMAGLPLPQRHE